MTKETLDLFVETSGINFATAQEKAEYREKILWDLIDNLQRKVDKLELVSKEDDFTMELMLAQISDLNTKLENPNTCKTCVKKLGCDMAQKSKDMFGTKLYEQWFNCYEGVK